MGRGPSTGWGMGDCRSPEDRDVGWGGRGFGLGRGRGFGRGFGRGRGGWRRGIAWDGGSLTSRSSDDDLEGLRALSSRLREQLDSVERRLSKVEKTD